MSSPVTVPEGNGPRNPVRVLGSVVGALVFLVGTNEFAGLVPRPWAGAITLAVAVLAFGWAEYTRGQVTPLARPRAADGVTPLVPMTAVRIEPGLPRAMLRADRRPRVD